MNKAWVSIKEREGKRKHVEHRHYRTTDALRKASEGGLLGNLLLLLALRLSVGVNTIHFDDRGTLGRVGRHNHLVDCVNKRLQGRRAYIPGLSSAL